MPHPLRAGFVLIAHGTTDGGERRRLRATSVSERSYMLAGAGFPARTDLLWAADHGTTTCIGGNRAPRRSDTMGAVQRALMASKIMAARM